MLTPGWVGRDCPPTWAALSVGPDLSPASNPPIVTRRRELGGNTKSHCDLLQAILHWDPRHAASGRSNGCRLLQMSVSIPTSIVCPRSADLLPSTRELGYRLSSGKDDTSVGGSVTPTGEIAETAGTMRVRYEICVGDAEGTAFVSCIDKVNEQAATSIRGPSRPA
jgi:hypothetical protein